MRQDNTVLIAAITSVIVVGVIIALVILIYFLRVRKQRRQQSSKPQESIGGQELVSNGNTNTHKDIYDITLLTCSNTVSFHTISTCWPILEVPANITHLP